MYNDETNTDSVFGTQEQFEQKYGDTTEDGTPRFGEDYAFLHHSKELDKKDKLRLFLEEANPFNWF